MRTRIDQDDLEEVKRQAKLYSHQTQQTKEEFSYQEATITKLVYDRTNVEKEKETLKVPEYGR